MNNFQTMEANEFITKLKATDTARDDSDLQRAINNYKTISSKLTANDLGLFSLNVLCILCRNLDKAPSWRDSIDNQALLTLTIECIRETRSLEKADRVKTLACIYHIHKHAVRQNKAVPPELIFKISFMPFELDSKRLLQEYYKTYGNIVIDRITYIERLKNKVNILKLLPKLTEDIIKVIDIYNTIEFCTNILIFLVKKLYLLYSTHFKDLNQMLVRIFTQISEKSDLKLFKELTEKEILDVYVKLQDCIYVIAENASKFHFKDCQLHVVLQTCITIVGHRPELFHCLQTFYINSFCCILKENTNLSYVKTVLNGMLHSFEVTEKLGYTKAMHATYPYLSQLLRLYIEYNVTNCSKRYWKDHFDIEIQGHCLKLIQFFTKKLNKCMQLTKCDSCNVKSGLHDALRLSFFVKHFVTVSLSQNIVITEIMPIFHSIILQQHAILTELNRLGCANYEKCFRKLQTDIHNTAISLNKAQYYEFSIKLFDIYLQYELKCQEIDQKNMSRALYNKSICELDCKLYEKALVNAYLSLIFCDDLDTDKYMSLVVDIKAKELKSKSNDEDEDTMTDNVQLFTVLGACKIAVEQEMYGDLKPFVSGLKLSAYLKHEFSKYSRLWPAMAPIGGVWKSLLALYNGEYEHWIAAESKETIEQTLFEVVLETPSVVRTVHSEHFTAVVTHMLDTFQNAKSLTPDSKLVHASLLLLKCEYDLAEASQKYKWKSNEPIQTGDPDQVPATRTIPQEHAATACAIVALALLTDLLPHIQQVRVSYLEPALQIIQVFVPLLQTMARDVEALQVAYICCGIAHVVGDHEAYIRNAGTLLYYCTPSPPLDDVIASAGGKWGELRGEGKTVYLCQLAIYYARHGAPGAASRLIQLAQAHILTAYQNQPDVNLDFSVGWLLEAQWLLCGDSGLTVFTVVNGIQRHYLSMCSTGSKWAMRRTQSLSLRVRAALWSGLAARCARAALLWRRARAAAGAALPHACAARRAALYAQIVDTASFDDAQIKIDNRLKHVLGLQPSNETQPYYANPSTKLSPFSPKQEIETMRDCMILKKTETSPSLSCMSVPAFKIPDFFKHSSECCCYACEIPYCLVLACKTSGLEAAMYSKANEIQIAKNYFEGVMKMFTIADKKMEDVSKKYKKTYELFIVDSVMKSYKTELRETQIEALIELSFLELKNLRSEIADDYIVRIHEIVEEMGTIDDYLMNNVMNLMTASARLKRIVKKPEETGLEVEFESLRLSPAKETANIEPPKTPVSNPTGPPKPAAKVIVKDEEVPKKRKVIKLNLDDSDEKDFEKPTRSTRGVKKAEFKVPNPIVSKATLEIATPRPSRSVTKQVSRQSSKETAIPKPVNSKATSRPKILLTQPSEELVTSKALDERPKNKTKVLMNEPSEEMATPKLLDKTNKEFFTPEATPEQFFTPLTSVKTYSKKSLRQHIVKNLEHEFSTPKTELIDPKKVDKENATTSINDTLKVPKKTKPKNEVGGKITLKRATSPGKLCKEKKDTGSRSRRLRQQVNFSVDEDDKT